MSVEKICVVCGRKFPPLWNENYCSQKCKLTLLRFGEKFCADLLKKRLAEEQAEKRERRRKYKKIRS